MLLLLLCLAPACQLQEAGTAEPQPGQVLFEDDFADPESGWNRVTTEDGSTDYADGVYRILVNRAYLEIWSKPGLDFDDVSVEVDAYKVSMERENRFGLICRAIDPYNFYTFMISSDGYYGIGKVTGEQYVLVGMQTMQPSEFIHLGSDLNHLRADCIGDTLTFYVNGQLLEQVRDNEFLYGDVGLIVGTYHVPGSDIRFDNFVVIEP